MRNIIGKTNTEYPFRLFFLLACVGAWAALIPWITLLLAPTYATQPLHWHAFAFLNLCAGAGFSGFLMTALPAWTDDQQPRSRHSFILLSLWLGILLTMPYPLVAAILSCLFWCYLTFYTLVRVIRHRKTKLISFVIVITLLAILSIRYTYQPDGATLHRMVDTMLIAVALVNFRVGRVLGNQALEDGGYHNLYFVPNPYAKNISVLILGLYLITAACGIADNIQGWLSLAVASAFAARLQDWHSRLLLRTHYVRAHYAVSLALVFGYAATGIAQIALPAWFSPARHLLAITAMLAMVLIIMSIAGMRHSGLHLNFYRDTRLAITLIIAAGLSRSLGALFFPNLISIYAVPSICIAMVFFLYSLRYINIFRHTTPH